MFQANVLDVTQESSTGNLPSRATVEALIAEAYARYADHDDGNVADYIPVLAGVDPDLFGLSLVGTNGNVVEIGDIETQFSIQSISKAFEPERLSPTHRHSCAGSRVFLRQTQC